MPTAEQRFVSFPNKYGPYVDTVGRNKKVIQEYIQNQLKEDELADQMSIKEYYDPFSGEKYPTRNRKK